ncbi:hypothetical protein [Micromonospora sp. WMMA1976]|uniref:hypothetical protein n=1 Tax=Micromonospora sp. WMMA1976 TaxID=3014995 RepID=UPI00248B3DBC|nr:hypothetical protein [Micromonospora sp. WMMA1976]WBC04842.1 hypothetical protein O7546_07730 [Micromonospora sp. WMMA1976]
MSDTGAGSDQGATGNEEQRADTAWMPSAVPGPPPQPATGPVHQPPGTGYGPPTAGPPYGPATTATPFGSAPPYGPYPPPGPPSSGRNRGLVVAVAALSVLLLVACSGLIGGAFLLGSSPREAAEPEPAAPPVAPWRSSGTTPTPGATASVEPSTRGPQPSDFPAAQISDLNDVCDGVLYYPQSPKRTGAAPHPVALLVGTDMGTGRRHDRVYYYDEGLSKRVERTWASEDPKAVQIVACLDRTGTGATIRKCRYDDPKPDTLTLLKATYRLRVYEVATGRRLLDKTLGGDDQQCPFVVLYGPDKKIYAEVSHRSLLSALRNLVKR